MIGYGLDGDQLLQGLQNCFQSLFAMGGPDPCYPCLGGQRQLTGGLTDLGQRPLDIVTAAQAWDFENDEKHVDQTIRAK